MRNLLMFILFFTVATVLMGMGVTAVLSMPGTGAREVGLSALGGFVLAIPVTWLVASQILRNVKL